MYSLFVPLQAVGANLVYFDLFHVASSGLELDLIAVDPVVSGETAVTGVVAVDLYLTRTTAVGTGGTAATAEGTALNAATFTHHTGSAPINLNQVSARLTPSGGATAGAVLAWDSFFSEETNAGTYLRRPLIRPGKYVTVRPGTGIRVVQGSVASVGNVGFNVAFNLRAK